MSSAMASSNSASTSAFVLTPKLFNIVLGYFLDALGVVLALAFGFVVVVQTQRPR
jgi:hypothetical protein